MKRICGKVAQNHHRNFVRKLPTWLISLMTQINLTNVGFISILLDLFCILNFENPFTFLFFSLSFCFLILTVVKEEAPWVSRAMALKKEAQVNAETERKLQQANKEMHELIMETKLKVIR